MPDLYQHGHNTCFTSSNTGQHQCPYLQLSGHRNGHSTVNISKCQHLHSVNAWADAYPYLALLIPCQYIWGILINMFYSKQFTESFIPSFKYKWQHIEKKRNGSKLITRPMQLFSRTCQLNQKCIISTVLVFPNTFPIQWWQHSHLKTTHQRCFAWCWIYHSIHYTTRLFG